MDYQQLLSYQLTGNSIEDLLIAFGLFVGLWILFWVFRTVFLARMERLAKKTTNDIDDFAIHLVEKIPGSFYALLGFYIAVQYIALQPLFKKTIDGVFMVIVTYQAIRLLVVLAEFIISRTSKKQGQQNETIINGIRLILNILLWSTGLLLVLSNLGFNITSLVASLGIGGIAIALAVQNILGDIFSSFSIYFDRPFEIGDFIFVGDQSGTVKKIGLKTTRIETLQGEELVISNNNLVNSQIRNFKKMRKRRVVFGLGVVYGTPVAKLKKINRIIDTIIKKQKGAQPDRVHFSAFGDFSLNFEVVYYLETRDYTAYMDTQQAINWAIASAFEKEKIEMAFPTQTIHLEK